MTRTLHQKTGGGNAQGICSRATGTGGAVGSKCSSRQVRSDRLCPAQDPRQRGSYARSRVSGAGRKLPKISFLSLKKRNEGSRKDREGSQRPATSTNVIGARGEFSTGVGNSRSFQCLWDTRRGNPGSRTRGEHLFSDEKHLRNAHVPSDPPGPLPRRGTSRRKSLRDLMESEERLLRRRRLALRAVCPPPPPWSPGGRSPLPSPPGGRPLPSPPPLAGPFPLACSVLLPSWGGAGGALRRPLRLWPRVAPGAFPRSLLPPGGGSVAVT